MAQAPQWGNYRKNLDNSQSEYSRQGVGYHENDARAKGYQGTFVNPANYADAYGQNMGQAMQVLQGGFSGQSADVTANQDALSKALQQRLGGLENNAQQRKQSMQSDLEQGFANQAAMLRRSAAGTGAGSSLGYGRAAGSMANDFQNNMAKGMLGIEGQMTQELGQLGGMGQQLFSQNLADRAQQYGQSQDLSNLFVGLAGKEGGRADAEAQRSADATASRKAAQAQLISSILSGAGAAAGSLAGPGGAAMGGQMGGSLYPQPQKRSNGEQAWGATSAFLGGM